MEKDKELFKLKLHYLLFCAGVAPMLLFTNTFAKQLGFSALTVGSIFTSMQIARVIGKLVFGALTDKLQAHKQIALLLLTISTVSFFLMMYIPPLQKEIFSEIYCGSSMNISLKVCSSKDFNKKSTCDSEATDFNFASSSIGCQMQCIVNQDSYRTVCRNAGPPTTNICKLFQKGNANISTDRVSLDGFSEWNEVSVLANEAVHLKTNLTSSFTRMEVLGNKSSCFLFNVLSMEDTLKSTLVSSTDLLDSSLCKQNDVKLAHCRTTCDNPSVTELGTLVEVKNVTEEYQLWVFLVLLVLGCVGSTVIVSISDTMTFAHLGESSSDFGKVRLWGSVGWGTFTLISGKLVDELSEDTFSKNYSPAFISSAIILSLDSLVVFSMKTSVKKKSKKLALDVGKILLNFETIIYLCWCISAGVCVGLCTGFFFW
ncbi:uncharacterized protein LOC120348748 [Nilaparvata lugens]|uniref:uncharacterized protein LOC120348748 n=1 Tax=Nilaparvata lugens TaxID=108931 RepID=UPI00193E1B54|nr:uncharacterized protein LOC120348748 [Nilaparvata lugens]